MRTIRICAILVILSLTVLGGYQIPRILKKSYAKITTELNDAYKALFVKEIIHTKERVVFKEKEPNFGDGIAGRAAYYAHQEGIPSAIILSVIEQESGNDETNRSFAIAPKYQEGGRSFKPGPERWRYAAYGLCGLTPAYTMDLCDYDSPEAIWGPDVQVIEKHLSCCAKRLKQDFEMSRAKAGEATTGYAQWDRALVRFYGARADGYQEKVLARAVSKVFKNAG